MRNQLEILISINEQFLMIEMEKYDYHFNSTCSYIRGRLSAYKNSLSLCEFCEKNKF